MQKQLTDLLTILFLLFSFTGFSSSYAVTTTNGYYCIDNLVGNSPVLTATCNCAGGGTSTVEWWDAETGGNLVATGDSFNPIIAGTVPADIEMCYTFYADCVCSNGCTGNRRRAHYQVLDCNLSSCLQGDCTYILMLEDSASNGWDGASIDVKLNNQSATNYKVTPSNCNGGLLVVPIQASNSGIIDLEYWNGAFENEHGFRLFDANGEIALDIMGNSISYVANPPANQTIRINTSCNVACCAPTNTEVRITMGTFPEDQAFQLRETNTPTTILLDIDGTAYAGLAPGTQIYYNVFLDKCQQYTFAASETTNNGWNGGTWELISSDTHLGTKIINISDSSFGDYLLMSGPSNPTFSVIDEVIFTIPCHNNIVNDFVVTDPNNDCVEDGTITLNEPFVCPINSGHAQPQGCVMESIIIELNGNPNTTIVTNGSFTYTNGTVDVNIANIPVGTHRLLHEVTYCDGIITRSINNLYVVTNTNPALTCENNVIIALGTPDLSDDDNNSGNFYLDDFGECVIQVTPDILLENLNNCNNEYECFLIDNNGNLVVIYDVNGLPLDQFGNSISPLDSETPPAHNLIDGTYTGQTLTFLVEHVFSGNKCWGAITVEDNAPPILTTQDYDIACTHPEALNENYTHGTNYLNNNLPFTTTINAADAITNTFIPIPVTCTSLGEIIQDIQIQIDLTHNDFTDLELILHAPSTSSIAPISLATGSNIVANNIFTVIDGLIPFLGMEMPLIESIDIDDTVIENTGNQTPSNLGDTWYIEIKDNNATTPNMAFGGGVITNCSIDITAGFPFPYAAFDCSLQSVEVIDEVIVETNCDQTGGAGATIERLWQATDAYGGTSISIQTVNLIFPDFGELSYPEDVSIECTSQNSIDMTSDITGNLQYNCFDLTGSQHGVCDISFIYDDIVDSICGNGFKITRTWTIIDWCNGIINTYVQIIKVEDTQAPVIANTAFTSNLDLITCMSNIALSEFNVTDACGNVNVATATYVVGGGVYDSNGNLTTIDITTANIQDLPIGSNEIMLLVEDECMNHTQQLITVNVADVQTPGAICTQNLTASLSSNGIGQLLASEIDDNSVSSCGGTISTLEVRRTDGCLGISSWDSFVDFGCCDTDNLVTVELRVTDANGNSDVCSTQVLVEDDVTPTPVCLNGISIAGPLAGNNYVTVYASDVLEYAFDNCSSDVFVENSVKMRILGSSDSLVSSIDIPCEDAGTNLLEVWVEDEAGNSNFCITYAIAQFPNGCCPVNLDESNTPIPNNGYFASNTVSSSGQVGNYGNVVFSGGQQVCLEPGFEVVTGAVFHAYIDGCPTPIQPEEEIEEK